MRFCQLVSAVAGSESLTQQRRIVFGSVPDLFHESENGYCDATELGYLLSPCSFILPARSNVFGVPVIVALLEVLSDGWFGHE